MAHDVAVVIPTILRKELLRAVRSVYAQDFGGSVHVLLGVDRVVGPREILQTLIRNKPSSADRTVFDRLHKQFSYAATGKATAYYVFRPRDREVIQRFAEKSS